MCQKRHQTNQSMAKILIISGNARSLIANRGDLIKELSTLGHHVIALIPAFDSIPEIDEMGIEYELISLDRRHMNPFRDLKALLELTTKIRRIKPDVVFSYTIKPVVYGTLAARITRRGVRCVALITGLGQLFTGRSIKSLVGQAVARTLYSISLPLNNSVIFQNPDDMQELGTLFGNSICRQAIVVSGSGVNMEKFPKCSLPSRRAPSFLLVSRLLINKGVIEFCEAAQILHKEFPNAKFNIVGPLDKSLSSAIPKEIIQKYKESKSINFHPPTKDVRPYLADCSVFVLPSCYREGTPRAILEAMSTGRAIITTDMPGCRETVVEGENGFLVQPGSVSDVVKAMRAFLENTALAASMGEKSHELVRSRYDVNIVNRDMVSTIICESND